MYSFRITPRARDDIKSIGRYTEQHWGKAQRNVYLRDLESRFVCLAKNSLLGKKRADICEGYYSFPQGEHVVFYLIAQEGIQIIGVPHKEMDVISYFQPHWINIRCNSTDSGSPEPSSNKSTAMETICSLDTLAGGITLVYAIY